MQAAQHLTSATNALVPKASALSVSAANSSNKSTGNYPALPKNLLLQSLSLSRGTTDLGN